MAIDPSSVDLVTFDCYGTLIDWETGIHAFLRSVLESHAVDVSRARLLDLYARFERQVESGPYIPYRDVLRRTLGLIGAELGFEPTQEELNAFADSVGDWPAFTDTPGALARLQSRYELGVLSNVDDDLFARTHERLGVRIDHVVTAEQVRSYKPARAHFEELLRRTGRAPDRVLHAAESRFHDIGPASELGFPTAWVNRAAGGPTASGDPSNSSQPDMVVTSVAELADVLGV